MNSRATPPVTGKTIVFSRHAVTPSRYYRILTIVFLAALCLGWNAYYSLIIHMDRLLPEPPPPPFSFCTKYCGDRISSALAANARPTIAGAGKPHILLAQTNGLGYQALLTFASPTQIEYQFHYGNLEGSRWQAVWQTVMIPNSRVFSLDQLPPVIRMSYPAEVSGSNTSWEIVILTDPDFIARSEGLVMTYTYRNHTMKSTTQPNNGIFLEGFVNFTGTVTALEIYDSHQTLLWQCSEEECLSGT